LYHVAVCHHDVIKRRYIHTYIYIYNRGKNGRENEKRKTENDVTGMDDERGLQQVEGETWTSWRRMAPLDM